jgi:hypothetical protein
MDSPTGILLAENKVSQAGGHRNPRKLVPIKERKAEKLWFQAIKQGNKQESDEWQKK